MNASAKTAILRRLRAVGAGLPRLDLERGPSRPTDPVKFATFDTLARALDALGVAFDLAHDPQAARTILAGIIARHQVRTAVRWDHADIEAMDADSVLAEVEVAVLAPQDLPERPCPSLAEVDMGLTGVSQSLAATGSLILVAGPGQERATALLPRLHVALVARSRLLPDLGAWLETLAGQSQPSARTCVSGLSSTGDIEFFYVRGVHGPLAAHVIGLDWL